MKPATRSNAWWYWLATLTGLAWGVAGWEPGYGIAMGVTLIHAAHWLRRGHREVDNALRACAQYLAGTAPEGPFRIYHQSFRDFLLEDTTYPVYPAEAHQALAALHPVGRMGEISDVVGAVLYLDGAGFVTGEVLHVDGGQAAGHHMP